MDLQTNLKIHNYEENKHSKFLVNDIDWTSKEIFLNSGLNTKILGNIKNINYEVKNIDQFKKDPTSELFGAIGLFQVLVLKNVGGNSHLLKPKMLMRYAPGSMRNEIDGSRLTTSNAFALKDLII